MLSASEKVYAILGSVLEPISKELAIELSGIDYITLDAAQKGKVDSIFTQDFLNILEETGEKKYSLSETELAKLKKNVEMKSVHKIIADRLWSYLRVSEE